MSQQKCRQCGSALWVVLWDEANREYVLVCARFHEAKRFFVLYPPAPPGAPERSPYAAAG